MFAVSSRRVLPGFTLSLGTSLLFVCLILLLPLSALVMQLSEMSWAQYWEVITNPQVVAAYKVTLLSAFVASIFNGVFGLLMAWILTRYRFPGRTLLDALMDLPFALPTAVAGLTLASLFSVNGFYGEWLAKFDIKVTYTWLGIAVAMAFTSIPFVVRTVQPVLEELGPEYEEAAETLGATRLQSFRKVVLPELSPALVAGVALSFTRSLGEFGAVIFIAGNIAWKTEVTSLMIFVRLQEFDYPAASAIASVILAASLLLLFLVMKARMHAFLALMVVSMGAGLFSGMPLDKIAATMEKGMGGTLGFLAVVVALGAMFGKILHETGAVDQIAVKMLKSFGHSRAHYAIGLAGLVCALPLFFEVAIVLLISVAFSMARHTGTNLVKLVIPLFAGVAAAAAFLVPGPAPMLLASQMNADFGWMILIGLCAAIPGMIIAGPLWGNFISRYVELHIPDDISEPHLGEGKMPSFGFSLSLILLPLVLVGLKTIAARFVPEGSTAYEWFEFIGHPFTAILVACLVAIYGLAMRQGMPKDKVMEICGHALQPAGIILLVIGAGGVFKQVLVDSGVGPALGEALTGMGLPIAITCFVLAAAVRIIQGSATVACLTAVGLVMPVIEQLNYSGAQMAALSICIAGGSIVVSHVNDAGFWLFGKFTGATEAETLKTWTMMETILGTVGAIVGMIAFQLLS